MLPRSSRDAPEMLPRRFRDAPEMLEAQKGRKPAPATINWPTVCPFGGEAGRSTLIAMVEMDADPVTGQESV